MRMLTISLGSWRREFDDALALFARAIELDPGTPEFHANHGNVLRMKSRLDEAEAAFTRALSLWPDFPEGLMNLATLRRNRGNLEDAEKLLRRAHSSSLVAPGARTVFNFSSFSLGPSSQAKPGGVFESGDEWVERALLMVGRAEIAQPGVRLIPEAL